MLLNFLEMVSSMIVIVGFIYMGKVMLDAKMKYRYNTDVEIDEKGNFAIAIRRTGFYLAIAIAMIPSIQKNTTQAFEGLGTQIITGFSILILLFAAKWISDKLILPHINNSKELQEGNVSVGIIEASLYIATGLILNGSILGGGPIYSYFLFFFIAQALLFTISKINLAMHKGLEDKIAKNNISSGVLLGGSLFSYAIILQAVLKIPFTDIITQINDFLAILIMAGLLMVLFANKAIDRIFLPNTTVKDEIEEDNYASMLMFIGLKISIAYVISFLVF